MARLEESFSSLKNKEDGGNNRLVAANALKTLSSELNQCSTDDCDSKSDVETQKDELIVSDKDSNFSRTFPEKVIICLPLMNDVIPLFVWSPYI